ncbi:MAG: DinB family protein [Planctomycetota bacterium]
MQHRQHVVSYLKWVRAISVSLLKDWPQDKFAHQLQPTDNHPIWVMGHLASTDTWIGGLYGIKGTEVPESYSKLFGPGSKPSEKDAYPSASDVRATFERTRGALLAWLEEAPETVLDASIKEKTGGFADDGWDAMLKLAWHEGLHFGQVATIRKGLGLPPVMG